MSCKPFLAVVALVAVSGWVAAEAADAPATAEYTAPAAGSSSPMEERVRAWRESVDRRHAKTSPIDPEVAQLREEQRAQIEALRQAAREYREERQALAEKWRDARRKYREEQLESWLQSEEKREARKIEREEALRNKAEEHHNYLVENHDRMLEEALQRQLDAASRHEEMRKQAEERRRKLAEFRATMNGMSAEERLNYMEEHRDELFGTPASAPPRSRTPLRPPWMERAVPPRPVRRATPADSPPPAR